MRSPVDPASFDGNPLASWMKVAFACRLTSYAARAPLNSTTMRSNPGWPAARISVRPVIGYPDEVPDPELSAHRKGGSELSSRPPAGAGEAGASPPGKVACGAGTTASPGASDVMVAVPGRDAVAGVT